MALTRFQDTEKITKDVEALVKDIEKLRLAYDQYFLGLDKFEPLKLREQIIAAIRKWATTPIQNVRTRFRYQQIVARYNTYTTYWDRILRAIEEGTYERDVFKAKLHEKARGVFFDPKASAAGKPTPAKKDPVDALFERYVASRKTTKEAVDGLSVEKFRATLKTQVEALKKKTGAASVKFQVAVEGGKTKLKAIPVTKK